MTETITLPRQAAEGLRDLLATKNIRAELLDAALADHVPWERAAATLAEMGELLDTPDIVHTADQTAAHYVEWFARFGIDLHDGRRLFDLLVTLSFITQLAHAGVERGNWSQAEADSICVLARSIGAVLTVLTPVEAR